MGWVQAERQKLHFYLKLLYMYVWMIFFSYKILSFFIKIPFLWHVQQPRAYIEISHYKIWPSFGAMKPTALTENLWPSTMSKLSWFAFSVGKKKQYLHDLQQAMIYWNHQTFSHATNNHHQTVCLWVTLSFYFHCTPVLLEKLLSVCHLSFSQTCFILSMTFSFLSLAGSVCILLSEWLLLTLSAHLDFTCHPSIYFQCDIFFLTSY